MDALPEVAGVKVYTNEDMQGDSKKNANLHKFRLEGDDADILEEVAEELEEVGFTGTVEPGPTGDATEIVIKELK